MKRENTTRRNFLGLMGKGSLAGAVIGSAGYLAGADVSHGDNKTALNFTCSCGEGLIAPIPRDIGDFVGFNCKCGVVWKLEWTGDGFKVASSMPKPWTDDGIAAVKGEPPTNVHNGRKTFNV